MNVCKHVKNLQVQVQRVKFLLKLSTWFQCRLDEPKFIARIYLYKLQSQSVLPFTSLRAFIESVLSIKTNYEKRNINVPLPAACKRFKSILSEIVQRANVALQFAIACNEERRPIIIWWCIQRFIFVRNCNANCKLDRLWVILSFSVSHHYLLM